MQRTPVIAIIDAGKTNKKLFLFDEDYKMVYERSAEFMETVDEDGDPCENLERLHEWVFDTLREVLNLDQFLIKAINFSAYGASFVYADDTGNAIAPLYNYLKAYPKQLQEQFYNTYGGEEECSFRTASPVLGSLNSGLQLYRIKNEQPTLFDKIKFALHLPQYLSFLLTGIACSDITSVGCHTLLWDFTKNDYHDWVKLERVLEKLPPMHDCKEVLPAVFNGQNYIVGIGLHDSSAALIPYLINFKEPFVLLSTGTWCIALNPFNQSPLTREALQQDCLCYMTYEGKPVKASRVFAGNEHEQAVKSLAAHFHLHESFYRQIAFDAGLAGSLQKGNSPVANGQGSILKQSGFKNRNLNDFTNVETAYHQLIYDLVIQQVHATQLVIEQTGVKRIFVDGGFSKNAVYMNLLAICFPSLEVFAASMSQATAVGSALSIHHHWNKKNIPADLIELKYYAAPLKITAS